MDKINILIDGVLIMEMLLVWQFQNQKNKKEHGLVKMDYY